MNENVDSRHLHEVLLKAIVFLGAIFGIPIIASAAPLGIPDDAVKIGEHYYKYVAKSGISWEEADIAARKLGGALAWKIAGHEITRQGLSEREKGASLKKVIPNAAYFWIGIMKSEGKTYRFDGIKFNSSSTFSSVRRRFPYQDEAAKTGNVFVGPVVKRTRRSDIYLKDRYNFKMDGFLCEWICEKERILPVAPTVHVTTLQEQHIDGEASRKVAYDKFRSSTLDFESIESIDGKKIQAVLHSYANSIVKIRDARFQNFSIPASRLSKSTKTFLESLPPDEKFEYQFRSVVVGKMSQRKVRTNPELYNSHLNLNKSTSPDNSDSKKEETILKYRFGGQWELTNTGQIPAKNVTVICSCLAIDGAKKKMVAIRSNSIPFLAVGKSITTNISSSLYKTKMTPTSGKIAVFINNNEVYSKTLPTPVSR